MNIVIHNTREITYIEGIQGKPLITNELDAVDVIGICGEHQSAGILLYPENLTENFFNLKSREAGAILQKFVNYGVRAAIFLTEEHLKHPRFKELAREAGRGGNFRMFLSRQEATSWLVKN